MYLHLHCTLQTRAARRRRKKIKQKLHPAVNPGCTYNKMAAQLWPPAVARSSLAEFTCAAAAELCNQRLFEDGSLKITSSIEQREWTSEHRFFFLFKNNSPLRKKKKKSCSFWQISSANKKKRDQRSSINVKMFGNQSGSVYSSRLKYCIYFKKKKKTLFRMWFSECGGTN